MFGLKKSDISTDSATIHEFLTRGVENVYPNREFLEARLKEGKKLSMYLGIDPTGPTLHVGHAIPLLKLKQFQELGHQVILLVGDFTGMIGDPTDKTALRKRLTREEVLRNASLYKKQASKFLDFNGGNKALLQYNSSWLSKMNFEDVVNLASNFTVQQMLERDMFEKRLKENRPIYLHEFFYPLMQGYDSVAMDVSGEIGGNDQTFNMLTGRTLMKQLHNKEKFVMTTKLLVDTTGKKMGKTEGNMLTMLDDEFEMFGKVMSWTDEMILSGFELCTLVSMLEVEQIKKSLLEGINPRDIKMRLAREIVTLYHGKDAAEQAAINFENTFKKGGVPEDMKDVSVSQGSLLVDILLTEGLVESKSDFRRLVGEGAVTIHGTEVKITDPNTSIKESITVKIGKRRFIKISVA
jgi:tyrosyl-tRNA synthetase